MQPIRRLAASTANGGAGVVSLSLAATTFVASLACEASGRSRTKVEAPIAVAAPLKIKSLDA